MVGVTLEERIEALGAVPLFAGLNGPSLEAIARTASEVEAPPGQVLIEPRMKGSGMFLLLDGTATVEARGRRARELEPGACFGELALLTPEGVRTARVRAKTAVRCLAIGRNDFQELLLAQPKVALAVLEVVATRAAAHE
jgi:trk system potassium uptake protein TrkA